MIRRWSMMLVFLLILGILTGCEKKALEETMVEGTYKIYYLNTAMTKLVPQEYKATSKDSIEVAQELMQQLRTVPKDLDCQPALSEKVEYRESKQQDQVLYLYFDANYNAMKATREILCRAALAKTLTQIEGVEYINIYTADQPLLDRKGSPVGMLSASDFIESITDVNVYEKTELTLFFANKSGEKLVEEKREVVHNMNTSLEKLALEQLIAGSQVAGNYSTLPADTKILNVSVNENVCYINFDSTFLTSTLEVKEYIPIYSIVNTLSELSTVNRVQIMVNGSQDVMFRDSIALNVLFERNLDYKEN